MNKKINLSLALILIVVFSAISFFAGLKYSEFKTKNNTINNTAMMENFRANMGERSVNNVGGAGRMTVTNSGGQVMGEIIKLEENNFTLSLGEQGSKLVYFNDETIINKLELKEKSELEIGKTISVSGTETDNQSLVANMIQIR